VRVHVVRSLADAGATRPQAAHNHRPGGCAQVAETTLGQHRLIVRGTKITDDPTALALFPEWRHHAIITNRTRGPVDLDADHRRGSYAWCSELMGDDRARRICCARRPTRYERLALI
jgi:hypothetical protein